MTMRLGNTRTLTWYSQSGMLLQLVQGSKSPRASQQPWENLCRTAEDQRVAANGAEMMQKK